MDIRLVVSRTRILLRRNDKRLSVMIEGPDVRVGTGMNRLGELENSAERGGLGRRRLVLALAGTLALAGCGWRPLYERPGASVASGGVNADLAKVSIDPVVPQSSLDPLTGSNEALYDSRAAQLLQNYLKNALNPYGPPSSAAYHLAIELKQQTRAAASLGNGTATREDLIMTAKYELNDLKGQPVLNDIASIVTSYDILREPYMDLSSRRDAQQRAAQQIAEAIQTRLAVFLRK
jgi:LPS-assembly lipoprotein